MSGPTQTCEVCGTAVAVRPDGRGFPPDIAARRLAKLCKAAGHKSNPKYRAGVDPALADVLKRRLSSPREGAREEADRG